MLHGKGSIIHLLDATKDSGRLLLWTWELWECGGGAGVDWYFCGKEVYPGKCSPLWLIFNLQRRGR
jgi:hypothetical protein